MVTAKTEKKRYPGCLAHAVTGMVYNAVANQHQPRYTYNVLQRRCQPRPVIIYIYVRGGKGEAQDSTHASDKKRPMRRRVLARGREGVGWWHLCRRIAQSTQLRELNSLYSFSSSLPCYFSWSTLVSYNTKHVCDL